MRNKKIVVIYVAIVLVVGILITVSTKDNSINERVSTTTFSENQDDSLTIQTEAEISNSEDAYKTAILFKENFVSSNKDKLTSENIKEIHVIVKGKYKSWLYDGTSSIKEVAVEK